MLEHLYTGGKPAPWPWVRLFLCRDVYRCRPSELDDEDWQTVMLDIEMLAVETRVKRQKRRLRGG